MNEDIQKIRALLSDYKYYSTEAAYSEAGAQYNASRAEGIGKELLEALPQLLAELEQRRSADVHKAQAEMAHILNTAYPRQPR